MVEALGRHSSGMKSIDALAGWATRGGRSLDELAELFAPRFCAVCRSYGEPMRGRRALCPRCSRLLNIATLNLAMTELTYAPCPVASSGEYEYELAHCLLSFKNAARTDLVSHLGSALARSLTFLCQEVGLAQVAGKAASVYLIPIPSSRQSVGRRGFAPAFELTRAASKLLPSTYPEVSFTVLEALRPLYTGEGAKVLAGSAKGAQKQLGQQARYWRMQGSLRVRQPMLSWAGRYLDLSGRICIICDDVATTGASIAEAYRVLSEAGACVVGAAAVARVQRRSELLAS